MFIAVLIWVKRLHRNYLTITITRHVCVTHVSRMLDILFTRFIHEKSSVVFIWKIHLWPFHLLCGWLYQDLRELYYGEFHIFWSKLGRNYNEYSRSSFVVLGMLGIKRFYHSGKTKHWMSRVWQYAFLVKWVHLG